MRKKDGRERSEISKIPFKGSHDNGESDVGYDPGSEESGDDSLNEVESSAFVTTPGSFHSYEAEEKNKEIHKIWRESVMADRKRRQEEKGKPEVSKDAEIPQNVVEPELAQSIAESSRHNLNPKATK